MAGPMWPDRSGSPELGPMTQLAAMLAKDMLRAHRNLLTAAPPEGLRPRPEQPRRPALPPAFPNSRGKPAVAPRHPCRLLRRGGGRYRRRDGQRGRTGAGDGSAT
jgi:hypothetical protein